MLRGSKNETLEKAFRRHQNQVAVQKNSPKFKAAASATAVPNTIVGVPKCLQEALGHLKESVERFNTQGPLPKHPVFGKLTKEQTTQLNCKHCAMHLSFAHPTKA